MRWKSRSRRLASLLNYCCVGSVPLRQIVALRGILHTAGRYVGHVLGRGRRGRAEQVYYLLGVRQQHLVPLLNAIRPFRPSVTEAVTSRNLRKHRPKRLHGGRATQDRLRRGDQSSYKA